MPSARRRRVVAVSARLLVLGLALVALSPGAHAQTGAGVRRIGYLGSSSPSLEPQWTDAFRQRLRELGHVEGKTVTIEYRWAEGRDERLPALAAELVGAHVDVIVTTGTPSAFAAKQATKTIPIVMASAGDPVRSGLIASLARPGGNITGVTVLGPELEGKRLEYLTQALPGISRVAVIWNPANPAIKFYLQAAQDVARTLHVTLEPVAEVRRVDDFEGGFSTIARARPEGLVVLADRFLLAHRKRIVDFAISRRLPGMYAYPEYVDAGGLMSYAPDNGALFRDAAGYVDKILKGARPGDLPVQEPSKFELAINLKTARTLNVTLPQALLLQADRVVQ
jgi:putative ABC transport system substrate-binding protein